MIPRRSLFVLTILLLGTLLPVLAITTVEVTVECPLCHTKNKFYEYASWGSYIYSYPSKFQLLFWPKTWSATIYLCEKCHLSLFMWDFKEFPKEKIDETAKALGGVKLRGDYKSYEKVPASEKLVISERVYKVRR